jgi:hypothetical protein
MTRSRPPRHASHISPPSAYAPVSTGPRVENVSGVAWPQRRDITAGSSAFQTE